jgi:chemotaxis protein MotB
MKYPFLTERRSDSPDSRLRRKNVRVQSVNMAMRNMLGRLPSAFTSPNIRQAGALVLSLLFLTACGTTRKLEQAQAEVDSLKADNMQLNGRLDQLADSLASCATQLERVEAENLRLAKEAADCADVKEALHRNLKSMNSALAESGISIKRLAEHVDSALARLGEDNVDVSYHRGIFHLSIPTYQLFTPGKLTVSDEGRRTLEVIALSIAELNNASVYVIGHADEMPVLSGWIDNWDLSAARANAVTRMLTDDLGLDATRVISGGRSFYFPVADNATPEGRAENRRIVIHVEPNLDRLWEMPVRLTTTDK